MAKDLSVCLLLDFYGNMLTDKQREVIDLYYNEDLSLAEIAEHVGITRQGVRDSIKRAEGILQRTEEQLGFAARLGDAKENYALIAAALQEITLYNERLRAPELSRAVADIRAAAQVLSGIDEGDRSTP